MQHKRLVTVLAILCILAGSAFAVEKLTQAVVDNEKCLGCGSCVKECPEGAITQDDTGIASVDKEKCIGCKKCVKACPIEAINME
jgi:Fe-S-cluster-containing hydrogenase component 2